MEAKATVILKLEGGLGNQLFEYAAGYYLAAKLGTDLHVDQYSIPLTTAHGEVSNGFGPFEVTPLPNSKNIVLLEKLPNRFVANIGKQISFIKRLLLKFRMFGSNRQKLDLFIEQNDNESIEKFFEIEVPMKLHGNFQSWGIVERAAQLGFPRVLKLKIIPAWIKTLDIDFENSVVLHLRLGDDTIFNADFKQPTIEYYLAATATLVSKIGSPNVYVLSDNLKRAKSFLGRDFPYNVKFLDMPRDFSPAERMYFMSLFVGIACANSTFCGWAAWSISNSGGEVIVPVPYSDGSVLGSRDFPSNWIQLNKYSGAEAG